MINQYSIGDQVLITAEFTLVSTNTLTNPTTTVITVKKPDGTELEPSTLNPSPGVFTAIVDCDVDGPWKYRATGTGACQARNDRGQFTVLADSF